MSRGFAKALRESVAKYLPAATSPFPFTTVDRNGGRGVLYEAKLSPAMSFYIFFSPAQNRDQYTLELAWASPTAYPFGLTPRPVWNENGEYDESKLRAHAFRTRIRSLLRSRKEVWWGIDSVRPFDSAVAALRALSEGPVDVHQRQALTAAQRRSLDVEVKESCESVRLVAIPWFKAVAAAHHISY